MSASFCCFRCCVVKVDSRPPHGGTPRGILSAASTARCDEAESTGQHARRNPDMASPGDRVLDSPSGLRRDRQRRPPDRGHVSNGVTPSSGAGEGESSTTPAISFGSHSGGGPSPGLPWSIALDRISGLAKPVAEPAQAALLHQLPEDPWTGEEAEALAPAGAASIVEIGSGAIPSVVPVIESAPTGSGRFSIIMTGATAAGSIPRGRHPAPEARVEVAGHQGDPDTDPVDPIPRGARAARATAHPRPSTAAATLPRAASRPARATQASRRARATTGRAPRAR